jgi:hypothetical protein
MNLNDLIADYGKQVQVRNDVLDTLKKHAQDPESSARLAGARIEIGMDAFRTGGMCSHQLMIITALIAHGATTERGLKALMLIQEEDQAREELGVKSDHETPRRVM